MNINIPSTPATRAPVMETGKPTNLPPQWLHVDPQITCRYRGTVDRALVKVIAQAYRAYGEVEPVKVAWLNGRWTLIDGLHRYEAFMLARDPEDEGHGIPAVSIGEPKDALEARWWASKANWTASKFLTRRERRDAFRRYVQADENRKGDRKRGCYKSYRDVMADLPGLPRSTVFDWMRQDFPAIAAAMSNDPENIEKKGAAKDFKAEATMRKAAKLRDGLIALGSGKDGLDAAREAASAVLKTLDGQTPRPMPQGQGVYDDAFA